KSSISWASSIWSGPVENQMGRSNSNALIIFENRSLKSDHIGDVLVGRGFFLVRPLPFLQVPDLETAAATHERYLAFQAKLATHVFRQDEPALAVGGSVFGARMQMAQKNPAVARGNGRVAFRLGAHADKLFRGHDEEKLLLRFGQNNELFAAVPAPARRDSDPVLVVDGVTELAGKEFLGLRDVVHAPADECAISIHFP